MVLSCTSDAWIEPDENVARRDQRAAEIVEEHRGRPGAIPEAQRVSQIPDRAAHIPDCRKGSEVEGAIGNGAGDGGVQAARRYARLLVSEIRLYNEDAVRSGREHRDLAHRLRAEIARARELFAERTPADLPLAEALFTEELVRTLADGDDSLMGNDEPGAL